MSSSIIAFIQDRGGDFRLTRVQKSSPLGTHLFSQAEAVYIINAVSVQIYPDMVQYLFFFFALQGR